MLSKARAVLETNISGFVDSIPMGDTYPPDQGSLQTFSSKDESKLTVNRNSIGTSGSPGWSSRIVMLGNFAVSPPELDAVAFRYEYDGKISEDLEMQPIVDMRIIQLAKVTNQLRAAANRLKYAQDKQL